MQRNIQKAIENRLSIQGYYRLVERSKNIENNCNFYYKVLFVIVFLIVIPYSLYFYPRTFEYLISHPISEILGLIGAVAGLYAIGAVLLFVVVAVIQFKIIFSTRRIYRQTYQEFGIEPPECEI